MKKIKVGITYDLKSNYTQPVDAPTDLLAEYDIESTVSNIKETIRSGGCEVIDIGSFKNLINFVHQGNGHLDIVFNIAEGEFGRNREAQVPVLLEAFKVPYVGSDGLTMSLTLDKTMAKKVVSFHGIPTPRFFVVNENTDKIINELNTYPLFAKPCWEGSSKGITEKSRIKNITELEETVTRLLKLYRQPVLIEEFIEGTEFTVAVIGNDPPEALPSVQVRFRGQSESVKMFYTNEMIYNDLIEYVCPAPISPELEAELKTLAVKAYIALGCLDFGRVDFRVDKNGSPFFIELNPLPALSLSDVFNIAPQAAGKSYQEIILFIINSALKRYGVTKT